jgi:hypothetical protein
MAKRDRKKAKKKAQVKRRKKAIKQAVERKPDIVVNHSLPGIANMVVPNVGIKSDRTIQFSHALAYEYCDLPIFEGERHVSDRHVQVLYDKMRRKLFNWRLIILSSAVFDGTRYKINGQHTCWAMVNLTPAQLKSLYGVVEVREIIYEVDTAADLKSVYSMYDTNLTRSGKHLTKVQLIGETSVTGISTANLTTLVAGLKLWLFEKKRDRDRYGPEESVALVETHKNTMRLVGKLLQDNPDAGRPIRRQGVVAAMFATFAKVPTLAGGFWQPVVDGLGLTSKTDPRYKLRGLIQEVSIDSAGKRNQRVVTTEDMYRMSVMAWNKWRQDSAVKVALRSPKRRVAAV